MNSTKKIRFGVMCNKDLTFPKWQADTISLLMSHNEISCELVIVNAEVSSHNLLSRILQLSFRTLLWQIYSYFSGRDSNITRRTSLNNELLNIPKLDCIVRKEGKYSQFFKEEDVISIKEKELDFILRFEFGIIKGDILNSSKHGIWSFHHGDEKDFRGGPPGFWEIYEGKKITGSILQKLNQKLDAGIVLKKCFLETNLNYIKNRDQMFLESSRWPLQLCIELLNNNNELLLSKASSTKSKIRIAPNNLQFINFILKVTFLKIKKLYKMVMYVDQWNIGVIKNKPHSFLEESIEPKINWLPLNSRKVFYADPCAIETDNGLDIFLEEYPYKDGKGIISYSKYHNGHFSVPEPILEEDFHLSYPYIFVHNNLKYIIPESFEANKVMLYQAVDYPNKWKMVKVLIDEYAGIDNTILNYNGTWWMFSSDKNDGSSHNLNLFFADDLFSEWNPHPCNPIKTDVRSSRSAGKPFIHNNNIYRPSMNYEDKNEGSITINLINDLSKNSYKETSVKSIMPFQKSKFSEKTHHLFSTKNFLLIDGCKETLIFSSKEIVFHQISLIINRLIRILGLKTK